MTQQKHGPSIAQIDIVLLFAVASFFYLLLFKFLSYPFFYEGDQFIFLNNADRMLLGDRLYRDFFSFHFPGCTILYYVLFLAFGSKIWVLGFATVVMGTLLFWLCLRISKLIIVGPFAYLPAIIFAFFGFRWYGLDGSHRTFSPIFILLAVLVMLRNRNYLNLALAGVFCALASFFTQQRGVAIVTSLVVFLCFDNCARGWRWKKFFKEMATILAAFVAFIFLLTGYFVITAGFETFFNSTLVYPFKYFHYEEQNNPGIFLINLGKSLFDSGSPMLEFIPALLYAFVVPLTIVVFFGVFWRYRKKYEWAFWRGPALVAIVGAFMVFTTTAPSYQRLFHISIPSLVLAFWLLNFWELFKKYQKMLTISAVAILSVIAATQAFRFQVRSDYLQVLTAYGRVYAAPDGPIIPYLWLKDHTKPGDFLFDVSDQDIAFLFQLRNSSRFSQFVPSEYTRPEFVSGAIEDLQKTEPRYIVWNNSFNEPEAFREPGDHLGPLYHYVISNYIPVGQIYPMDGRPMQIWEKKTAAAN